MSGRQRVARQVDQVGVLTIRVWFEPGVRDWRARIISSRDIDSGTSTTSVHTSADDVCEVVRDWLEQCTDGARS